MKVYLDYVATSPVKDEVKKAMMPYLTEIFGNPSSIHRWGQEAKSAIEKARGEVALFLGAKPQEIIFTSGGTEADNLAVRGISNSKVHIITTQIEHHAILKTCEDLEKNNIAEVTYLKPNREGLISALQVKKALKKNTVLVSVMYVNNEIGTVQPIREIGKMIEKENKNRLSKERIYFHTDAVQAVEYLNVNVDFLHVDLLTLSGHKIGATKGIGALYLRSGTPFEKIIFGGEQEMNLRAGTENVSGIVSLGKAIELIQIKNQKSNLKIKELRDYFIKKIITEIPEVELNGSRQFRSPNNANFYFKYVEGESILLSLDLVGIAASSGSACTSLSLKPSHVLMATYDDAERSHGSIRFTLGQETTKEEIDYTISNLKTIIKRLREISPLGSTK